MHIREHDRPDEHPGQPRHKPVEEAIPAKLLAAAGAGQPHVLGAGGLLYLQRHTGNAAARHVVEEDRSPVLDVVGSGGQPLATGVREDMEARIGADLSDVRVHTDDAAHRSAEAVSARAYTVGSDVVFQRNLYDPSSSDGQLILAHELTHVVQQRSGAVDGTDTGSGVRVSDPSDRFEREAAANAERIMSVPAPHTADGVLASAGGSSAEGLQRDEAEAPEEDEATVQGAFVQRAEAEELEEDQPEG